MWRVRLSEQRRGWQLTTSQEGGVCFKAAGRSEARLCSLKTKSLPWLSAVCISNVGMFSQRCFDWSAAALQCVMRIPTTSSGDTKNSF